MLAALGSDGLFENVPTVSPSACFATGPFANANSGQASIVHDARCWPLPAHWQTSDTERDGSDLLRFAPAPIVRLQQYPFPNSNIREAF
jgi:hypothetical protein